MRDIAACKTSSHMLRHLIDVHEEEEEHWDNIQFGMRIIKSTRTAFHRQILESVQIQKSRNHHILNAKAEYNRCALPRLTAKLGEKELKLWREEDKLEQAKEASIEEKIRIRHKEKAKKRGAASRRMEPGQPRKKRLKLDSQGQDHEEGAGKEGDEVREDQRRSIQPPPIEKRKDEGWEARERGPQAKKARRN